MMQMTPQQHQEYNPDLFEYDEELPEGQISEKIILSNELVPKEMGYVKTIGIKKTGGNSFNSENLFDWEDHDDEDDARIEAFLQDQTEPKPKKKMCSFYQSNSCRNGKTCPFSHDMSDEQPAM